MKNPLIKSALIVFFFWYTVLYLMSDAPLVNMPATLLHTILWVALTASVGVSVVLAKGLFYRGQRDQRLMGRKLRGASTTLGHPPIPGLAPRHPAGNSLEEHWKEFGWTPRGEVPPEFWDQFPWWSAYCKKHPTHAAAFVGCAQVMFGMRSLPASPVPGGHGGVSLIRHSISVLNMMMKMAPEWKFTGHRNKKGQLTADGALYDLTKTHHAFDFRSLVDADFDPILPLVAFAHDIGKVRCYEPVNWKKEHRSLFRRKKSQAGWDGPVDIVREVKPLHGREGARLLRRMAEIHNLPMRDRDALTISVGYYHEISEMPKASWIDDRVRSLTHLLYEADVATGVQEGDLDALSHNVDVALVMTAAPEAADAQQGTPPPKAEAKSGARTTEFSTAQTGPIFPPLRDDDEFSTPLNPINKGLNLEENSALSMVRNLFSKPGTVNHPRAKGAAYKYGDWIFMQEFTLRRHLAELYQRGDLARPGTVNNSDPFTLQLLSELHQNGWMFNSLEGYEYSAMRALWDIDVKKGDGKTLREKFVIVASINAFPELAALPDATPRQVICCSFGAHAAINKKHGPVNSTPTSQKAADSRLESDPPDAQIFGPSDDSVETVQEALMTEEVESSRRSLMDDALDAAMGLTGTDLEPMRFDSLKALAKRPDIPFLEVDGRRLYKESIICEHLDTRKEIRGPNSGVKGTRVNGEVFFYLDPNYKEDA